MNNDIQTGDTVEVLLGGIGFHPTEDRWLKAGDRVVVDFTTTLFVYYKIRNLGDLGYLDFSQVKKVTPPNQVEIKFR
jgi:hypothetical protein